MGVVVQMLKAMKAHGTADVFQATGERVAKSALGRMYQNSVVPETIAQSRDYFLRSVRTNIWKDGPDGQQLALKLDMRDSLEQQTSAALKTMIDKDVFAKLDPDDIADGGEFFKHQDGDGLYKSQKPKVLAAARSYVDGVDATMERMGKEAELGMLTPDGKVVPWAIHEGQYFPRIMKQTFWRDVEGSPSYRSDIIKQMVDDAQTRGNPISPEIAEEALLNSAASKHRRVLYIDTLKSAKLGDFQRARESKLAGSYIQDPKVAYYRHINEFSERYATSRVFGPKDLAGEELQRLIQRTNDPSKTMQLMRRVLGREERSYIDRFAPDAINAIGNVMAWRYLSKFAINNINQLSRIPMIADRKAVVQGISEFVTDKAGVYERALESGAISSVMAKSILRQGTDNVLDRSSELVAKWYGIEKSEMFNRALSSAVGEAHATNLFKALKRKPASNQMRKELVRMLGLSDEVDRTRDIKKLYPELDTMEAKLAELHQEIGAAGRFPAKERRAASLAKKIKTLRAKANNPEAKVKLQTIDEVLEQADLTPEQIKNAGFNMSKFTQGIADNLHMPQWISDWAPARLWWMFRRYAFTDTANIYNAIKTNPKRAIPVYLGASQVFGEIVGDAKATIKSVATGEDYVSDRGEQYEDLTGTDNAIVNRMVSNMLSSWMFGLMEDLFFSVAKGPYGMLQFIAGVPGQTLVNTIGDPGGELKRSIPVVGTTDLRIPGITE